MQDIDLNNIKKKILMHYSIFNNNKLDYTLNKLYNTKLLLLNLLITKLS